MNSRLILPFVALLASVSSNDVTVGVNAGRKIFDEKRDASPALWRQTQTVTVSTNGSDVISQVVITDLRSDKDGDAEIVEGGEGHQNVTVELKSPTVLRGYEFQIQVFAVPEEEFQKNRREFNRSSQIKGEGISEDPVKVAARPNFEQPTTNFDRTTKLPEFTTEKKLLAPLPISTDFQVTDGTRRVRHSDNESNATTKGMHNTPKLNPSTLAGQENFTPGTVKDNQARNGQDRVKVVESQDETNKPKMLTSNLPPYVLNRNIENATNFPMTVEKDLKTNGDQSRHIENEDSVHNGQKTRSNPTNTRRNFDSATNNISKNLHKAEEKKAVGNVHHPEEQNRPLGVIPFNFGESTENLSTPENKDRKTAIDAQNGKALDNVNSHMHNMNDGKIPMFPSSNTDANQAKSATEKPRNTRDTKAKVEETKNIHKIPSTISQTQVKTTPKNTQDDTKNETTNGFKSHETVGKIPPSPFVRQGSDSTSVPRNTSSSKPSHKDSVFEESDVSYEEVNDGKLKVFPRVVEHHDAANKNSEKPVITTE